jgi:TPR repeat protein
MSPEDTRGVSPEAAEDAGATLVRPAAVLPHGIPPGTLLVNTYQVERLLGGGGMGEVYLARHTGLGTRHAVKVIRPAMAMNRQVMDLFYREARVLRGVRHDAVVSYDGFVRDDQGRDYLVMEYVEGPSLADRLRRGPLSAAEVLALRDRLAAGLAEAHRCGAVHRDISPDNVILPGERIEAAKLIDFGVCKLTDPTQETIIGSSFAGKYRYASPEQLGLCGGGVDARSDIYSLGLILAAAAQGRALDMGDSIEGALRSRQSVPDLSGVPAGLRDWLAAMLQPDPARRPATLEALLDRWPAEAGGGSKRSTERGRQETAGRAGRGRRRGWRWALGLVLLAGVGGGLWWLLHPLPEPRPQPQPQSPDALGDLRDLIRRGRLDDAFALAQGRLSAGRPPPVEDLWALAQGLLKGRRLDPAFALMRELANAGHGPAAFALAEMYDPLHWSNDSSPFSKPNGAKARDWYRRAADAGMQEADVRLKALATVEEAP